MTRGSFGGESKTPWQGGEGKREDGRGSERLQAVSPASPVKERRGTAWVVCWYKVSSHSFADTDDTNRSPWSLRLVIAPARYG
jgi:hypothetical protein